MDERFLMHSETNGRRQLGYILMSRNEAAQHLLADLVRHERDGWTIDHDSRKEPFCFAVTKGSSTRRVWLQRYEAVRGVSDKQDDIRRSLSEGFRYPGRRFDGELKHDLLARLVVR